MRHRQDITELFSTFLQFETDIITRWTTDAKLRRSFQGVFAQSPDPSELVWTIYWHRIWDQTRSESAHNLASLHLSAYLQESCYWAAYRTFNKFSGSQFTLLDYFQIAIAEVSTVLRGFRNDRGASLRTYAEMVFQSILRDGLRQRQAADLCTDWTLLRKISKKRLIESLQHAGLSAMAMTQYKLAWTCFKTLYVPASSTERLPKPDLALWQAVARLYNEELNPGSPPITARELEQWLSRCAVWVRSYLYPSVASLNVSSVDENTSEIQDRVAADIDTPLGALIDREEIMQRQSQYTRITQVLEGAIAELDAQTQMILQLYYQKHYTQQQIMKQLALGQATVSRRLSKAREFLLTALVQWSQAELNNLPTPTLIGSMSTGLEEWLCARYSQTAVNPT
ncbi:MAG: sigma-70 family RNA polymerase sigma factor [Drouetiella hepatica Uher 2000/2452]|jgi:RNA polymerase sigma factor (sigma-70 family)|uniref:Sigma-70 family RNA polymerase sigma factor n=1 Tax=Drouetiella hepatica Uher 2000/2452 TaxID=904376 RepID=A0A951QGM9_9CYAN|nr:sigma-70 family RNA polymerase sigma factor [Drouetiella hepatica Uher 2000/2452]